MRKKVKMATTLFLILTLAGCSNKAETVSENASSYKNHPISSSSNSKVAQPIDSTETSEPEATKSSASESIDSEFTIGESSEETTENKQVSYSEGEFSKLHEELIEKYSVGYQSFSKEALIDLYGVGCNEKYFEDAIGFIAQNSYNQLFVFKNCSEENIELFRLNILKPIEEDPSVEDVEWENYSIGPDVEVLCIGDKDFMASVKEMIIDSLEGGLNE